MYETVLAFDNCRDSADENELEGIAYSNLSDQNLEAYFDIGLDFDQPNADSPWWTDEDTEVFPKKKQTAYEQLCKELGDDYEVICDW